MRELLLWKECLALNKAVQKQFKRIRKTTLVGRIIESSILLAEQVNLAYSAINDEHKNQSFNQAFICCTRLQTQLLLLQDENLCKLQGLSSLIQQSRVVAALLKKIIYSNLQGV